MEKLDASSRLALLDEGQIRKGLENGVFCLPKDQTKDRLILDARCPNAVESAEKRWVYSLGSAAQLGHLFLDPNEVLVLHAEDLQDFYYSFITGPQRQSRNCLKCKYRPEELQHLACFKEAHRSSKWLVPVLSTMAMGDTNAVSMGQTAHLSVILRTGLLKLEDFVCLRQRPSREKIRAGLMIDDFVLFESMDKKAFEEMRQQRTPGGKIVDTVRAAYTEAGLVRSVEKAVEQQLKGEFWGLQCDGERGILKPNLKRTVPLAFVLVKMVKCGHASKSLLEVLSGSLCAAFQCRRRCMSVLHEIYCAQRGRNQQDIVKLSPQLKDELLVCAGLLVVAAIDMRLRPSEFLVCSDASSLSTAEAAVIGKVGAERTKELQRHTLQKGLWNRLLSPASAYLREKGLLPEEAELPEDAYEMHPLWEEATACTPFVQLGKTKKLKKQSDISTSWKSLQRSQQKEQWVKNNQVIFTSICKTPRFR